MWEKAHIFADKWPNKSFTQHDLFNWMSTKPVEVAGSYKLIIHSSILSCMTLDSGCFGWLCMSDLCMWTDIPWLPPSVFLVFFFPLWPWTGWLAGGKKTTYDGCYRKWAYIFICDRVCKKQITIISVHCKVHIITREMSWFLHLLLKCVSYEWGDWTHNIPLNEPKILWYG